MSANKSSTQAEPVNIRLAKASDVESITTVINAAFRLAEDFFVEGDRIDQASVLDFLHSGKFLLAEKGSHALGCVYVELHGERAYLGLLSVDPSGQQLGLGSLLMERAETYCRENGARFMDIKVVNLREELFAFYHKRGYLETGISPFPAEVPTRAPCHFVEMSKPL